MDISVVFGMVFAVVCILVAYFMDGGALSGILIPQAALIILGGTIGAVVVSFPVSDLKSIPDMLKILFSKERNDEVELISFIVELSEKARREGLLALETDAQNCQYPLLQKGLSLIVDGVDPQMVKDIMNRESYLRELKYVRGAKIFQAAGGFSPTMGIIGTVMGLVSVLGSLEDAGGLGEKIALAFVATLYGIFFANIMWLPFESRIKAKSLKENIIHDIIIEGVLSIQVGENPRLVKEKLNLAFLESMNGKGGAPKAEEDERGLNA